VATAVTTAMTTAVTTAARFGCGYCPGLMHRDVERTRIVRDPIHKTPVLI
jgi:hypothetical protein